MRVHEISATELWKMGESLKPDERVKVAHNTWIHREELWVDEQGNPSDLVVVTYHRTEIAYLFRDGSVIVDNGGWSTSTTKNRLNSLLPGGVGIYQEDWRWYFWKMTASSGVKQVPYHNWSRVYPDGTVTLHGQRIL